MIIPTSQNDYAAGFADGYSQGKKDAERKKGRWLGFDSDEDMYDIIKCSCCKHTFTVDSYHWSDIGFVKDDFNYCPNCGADMRGEEHG